MKRNLILVILFYFLFFSPVIGRENVYDWYIKDFQTEIIVNKDSSLLITEKITADCGNAPNKHGIFRVLPYLINTPEGIIKTPIELINITDFDEKPLKYSTIKDPLNHTITWKIGDPNKTVQGINYYKIVYRVKNTIRFQNPKFDEFYWNLNGNFWDLEIDNFTAKIIFPKEINQNNTEIDYYTGELGSKNKDLANYQWIDKNILQFTSTRTLNKGEGITVSVIFPKGILKPYTLTFLENLSYYLLYIRLSLLPLITFIICFYFWLKYGKDPYINKPIIPEYDIPENLTPIEMGMLMTNGVLDSSFISATLIDFAIKGLITIEEIKKPGFLMEKIDYKIKKTENGKERENRIENPETPEKILLMSLPDEFLISSLKNKFFKKLSQIEEAGIKILKNKNLITKEGLTFRRFFFSLGLATVFLIIILPYILKEKLTPELNLLFISLFFSGLILIIFSYFIPKRTQKGADILWKIRGFRLYMETAEKYRQQFYERENIFEKFLPYAMIFGITDLWIKKMQEIYGKEYTYLPGWYSGTKIETFNINSFSNTLHQISSAISSSIGDLSGAHGGGSSGGGGGGGGGGGW